MIKENIKEINFFTINFNNELEYYTCYINKQSLREALLVINQLNITEKTKEFKEHPLSLICNELLNITDEIKFSYAIRSLLEWDIVDYNEAKYQKMILESMKFIKQKVDSHELHELYSNHLAKIIPWFNNKNNKINIFKEIKGFLTHQDSIYTKKRTEKVLVMNLPYSSDLYL